MGYSTLAYGDQKQFEIFGYLKNIHSAHWETALKYEKSMKKCPISANFGPK
jgi:hypothetical protein